MSELIPESHLPDRLGKCPRWRRDGAAIARTFRFESFSDAIEFVRAVATLAEESNHHPDIDIRYRKVTLRLTTHDRGGLTDLDFTLAQRLDALVP